MSDPTGASVEYTRPQLDAYPLAFKLSLPAPSHCHCQGLPTVIASAARQSRRLHRTTPSVIASTFPHCHCERSAAISPILPGYSDHHFPRPNLVNPIPSLSLRAQRGNLVGSTGLLRPSLPTPKSGEPHSPCHCERSAAISSVLPGYSDHHFPSPNLVTPTSHLGQNTCAIMVPQAKTGSRPGPRQHGHISTKSLPASAGDCPRSL